MFKKIVIIVIALFLIIAFSVNIVFPKNSNFNYITLTVGASKLSYDNNCTITVEITSSNYSHEFLMTSSPNAKGKANSLGIEFFWIAPINETFPKTFPIQCYINDYVKPNLSTNYNVAYDCEVTLSNFKPDIFINYSNSESQNSNWSPGYYYFCLGQITSCGNHYSNYCVNYKNDYFKVV